MLKVVDMFSKYDWHWLVEYLFSLRVYLFNVGENYDFEAVRNFEN